MNALLCKFEQQFILVFSFAILLGSVDLATADVGSTKATSAVKTEEKPQTPDYYSYTKKIRTLMQSYIYNPKELDREAYLQIENKLEDVAKQAKDTQSFVDGFNELWYGGPFSHVRIAISDKDAEETAEFLDNMRVGGQGASLTWKDDIAIMTVRTMMGVDTIEQIEQFYKDIEKNKPQALIIDLRENNGGAFAVKPLVSHLLSEPLDAGVFTSRKWAEANDSAPTMEDVKTIQPWEGWSIRSFWKDVQDKALTRVQMQPTSPYFGGKVVVLTSNKSASAAELAADALHNLPNVTVIGETTAGEMLSQKMFNLADTLQLLLPVADYYSARTGRIEGVGVIPDIQVASERALEMAIEDIQNKEKKL